MPDVVFYFQVHQPDRLRAYSVFSNTKNEEYFDEELNRQVCQKVAENCYLPANRMMLDLIKKHKGKFRVAYSISGVALDQFKKYTPDVLASFRNLARTGCVEFLGETYYHSLSFLYNKEEFYQQVKMHEEKMVEYFDYQPNVFRNTELIYQNELADFLENIGYSGVLTEGAEKILDWRSPDYLYSSNNKSNKIKILLKNFKLSDDIAFRFSNTSWSEWPLTADKYASWISNMNEQAQVINLFMDYETFGEHQWADTGIFDFLYHLPAKILESKDNGFVLPSEAIAKYKAVGQIDVSQPISWADIERDISAWTGNRMQQKAANLLYSLTEQIKQTADHELVADWRSLTTSDHFYYMSTKFWSDGDVHKYFSPYPSPYDAFISYMNVLDNIQKRLEQHQRLTKVYQFEYAINKTKGGEKNGSN